MTQTKEHKKDTRTIITRNNPSNKFKKREERSSHKPDHKQKKTKQAYEINNNSDHESKGHRGILQRTTDRQKPKKQRNIEDNHRSKETMTETKDTQEK
jgi:hypothetical protein